MYYNATTPTRIRVSYACSKEEPEDMNVTYILKWIEEKAPIYNFNVHDAISTGSHHWDNTDGHFGSYTYTFKEPDAKTHYQFLYYKLGDNIYNVNDKYSHDITGQGYGTDVTEDAYAYWQADVTINLYSDGKPDEVEKPEGNNPQTGDNIYLYLITLLISLVGFVGGKKFIKENN